MTAPAKAPPDPPPRVSAVIPLYNCLPLTRRCLATLQGTLPADLAHEIIFVDDGSTDGTAEWLDGLPPPCRAVRNERNLGFAAACNRGAAAARGEFVFLLNNDLEFLPGWLDPMLDGFSRLPRAGVIGNIQLHHETGEVDHAGLRIGVDGKPAHVRQRAAGDYARVTAVTGACVAFPRALFAQLGAFDEGFVNGGEDVDFCLRAGRAGRGTWVALQSTVRHHVSATPGRKRRDEENSYRLFRRWRAALEREAWRSWCEEFLEATHGGRTPRHRRAEWRAWAFLRGWLPRPGRWAESAVRQALLEEEARWERLLARS